MTDEELKKKIEDLFEDYYWDCHEPKANRAILDEQYAQKAIALIREAGYEPPVMVTHGKEGKMDATIKIKYDGKTKTVAYNDFLKSSQKMLADFGLNTDEEHIDNQIKKIFNGEKLDTIGTFIKEYIV